MYFRCDCSIDHDNPASVVFDSYPVARRPHRCCECGKTIHRGEQYERTKGCWDGSWSTYKTCIGCANLRDDLCSGGWEYGNVANQIEECLGFDYRVEPSELEDDDA